MSDLQAVLFDMDGTLVDSEELWDVGLAEVAVRLGGRLSAEVREAQTGVTTVAALHLLYADLGVQRSADEVADDDAWLQARVGELMAAGVAWRSGARELLLAVRAAGIPTALVTSTERPLADVVLAHLVAEVGDELFEVTVCGDEVPARKPHPAPYQLALEALGVRAAEAVAVEDSASGTASARAAGLAVLAVPGRQDLPSAPGVRVRPGLDGLVGVGLADLVELLLVAEEAEFSRS